MFQRGGNGLEPFVVFLSNLQSITWLESLTAQLIRKQPHQSNKHIETISSKLFNGNEKEYRNEDTDDSQSVRMHGRIRESDVLFVVVHKMDLGRVSTNQPICSIAILKHQ